LADGTGHLKEWYRYDLHGTPIFYDATNNQISSSTYSIRHLFTGQQWYAELGLYDLRHRMYSSDIGRFLQPDPIGFNGDRTNLYRYCGNNPSKWSDPTGLFGGAVQEAEPVRVSGQDPNTPRAGRVWGAGLGGFGGGGGRGGGGGGGARAARVGKKNWIDDPTQSYDQMGQVGSDTVDNAVIYGAAVTPSPTAGNFSLSALGNLLGGGHSWDPLYNLLDRPATAEQKAWTDRGRVPTLIAASVLAAPLVAPAAFVEILALSPELVTAVYSTAVIGTSTLNPVAAEQVMNEPFEIWITEWIIQGGK
jgi:RHS repeat-associated protein